MNMITYVTLGYFTKYKYLNIKEKKIQIIISFWFLVAWLCRSI